ncbi:MAG TPA: ABC transporter ATP-binding protein [Methanomassiliicoccales archaeon]|jgi:NitT/TauT family transport system ATP-binding protein
MINVEHLSKSFEGGFQVIDDLTFSVEQGRSLAIIGPSGCGKTTLLYILAGLTRRSTGIVTVNGRPVEGPSTEVSFILQDFGLLPWKTVMENVCLGMKLRGTLKEERERRADRLIGELGLEVHHEHYPARLSGGERQRVAIGRALATEPKLLLMDEPFSSLDTLTRERMQEMLLDIRERNGLTMVVVTHSIEEAAFLGDSILVLGGRPCTIRAIIDNPGAGSPGHRGTDAYFSTCKAVRKVVEGI